MNVKDPKQVAVSLHRLIRVRRGSSVILQYTRLKLPVCIRLGYNKLTIQLKDILKVGIGVCHSLWPILHISMQALRFKATQGILFLKSA